MLTKHQNFQGPRERFLEHGVHELSLEDLIALVLGRGSKKRSVFQLALDLKHYLSHARYPNLEDLNSLPGMGLAQSLKILSALELGKRLESEKKFKSSDRGFQTSQQVFQFLKGKLQDRVEEYFYVLYLDSKNRPLHTHCIAAGTESSVAFLMKKVFQRASMPGVVALICAHNHPSGSVQPSKEDIRLTERILKAAELMQIHFLDHLIIGQGENYFSFKDKVW